jgi:hypothetical protein
MASGCQLEAVQASSKLNRAVSAPFDVNLQPGCTDHVPDLIRGFNVTEKAHIPLRDHAVLHQLLKVQ